MKPLMALGQFLDWVYMNVAFLMLDLGCGTLGSTKASLMSGLVPCGLAKPGS